MSDSSGLATAPTKVNSFNYTQHGVAEGTVKWISEGAFVLNDDTGQPGEPYYRVRTAIDRMNFVNVPANFRLIPRHDPFARHQGRPPHALRPMFGTPCQGRRQSDAGALTAMGAMQNNPGLLVLARRPRRLCQGTIRQGHALLAFRQSRGARRTPISISASFTGGRGGPLQPRRRRRLVSPRGRERPCRGAVSSWPAYSAGRAELRVRQMAAGTGPGPSGIRRLGHVGFFPEGQELLPMRRPRWIGSLGRRKPNIRSQPRCSAWCCSRVKASSRIPPPRCAG